jgi:DNA polymerase III alpha subunit|nr:MAG TPA: DNA polymerase III, alpha subunit [Caudoviricetes sp.]
MEYRYNNYHKHDYYTNVRQLDVVCSPMEYIQRAKELDGDKAIFFSTNHGYQGNIHEYYTMCKENNIKLIAGVEAYYVSNRLEKDKSNYHLVIIAKDKNGYKQINKIMSEANASGFYYKPRIDDELLFSLNPNDVIITTACVASRLRDIEGAEDWIIKMKNYFGNNFYLEVQNHNTNIQKEYNKRLLNYAKKYNIEIIHANDSHYIKPEDSKYRDLFLRAKGIVYEEESNFILDYPDYETIVERYKVQGILSDKQIKQALDNTLIFDNFEGIEFDTEIKMPCISNNPSKELGEIIENEFKKELNNIDINRKEEYIKAINEEWKVISDTNMYEYFLVNHKMIKLAIEKYGGVITKSSRGSCPSFYINKLLGFTSLDRLDTPITLYPSRFMSTTRILQSKSLPDIDTNVAVQQPFIDASKELLGDDSCQWMLSFKPLQESSAFRLYCKSIGMNISEYNEIAKELNLYKDDPQWNKIIEESKHFVGVIESVSQSPCSTLLLNQPISEEIGLLKAGDVMVCNIDGINCDKYKYLKNDILAVSVWDIINETCKLANISVPSTSELNLLLDDKVWHIYEKGLTCTINQADSKFATDLVKKYKPKSIAEMSAFVASIRPGFASLLDNFIERKPYTTGVEKLDNLLEDSYHYLMYQESIMKYLIWLGIDESETYTIIKKIAKKKFKEEELINLKEKLKKGWSNIVGREEGFEETWQVVEDASRYSFNASHSLSYAYDSLYGAYLKSHYPLEYYTVAMNNYTGDEERTTRLTEEMKHFNIKLKNPKFRYSKGEYFMDKETNSIYKGISSIKFISKNAGEILYNLKDNKYDSFIDLLIDIGNKINSKNINILIRLDFFSEFGTIPKLLKVYELYQTFYGKKQISKEKYPNLNKIFTKFAIKESDKIFKFNNTIPMLKFMEKHIKNKENNVAQLIRDYFEFTGSCDIRDKSFGNKYLVVDINTKYAPKITLYSLSKGKSTTIKIYKKHFKLNPLKLGDIIGIKDAQWKYKKKEVDNKWIQTEEKELIVESYKIY